MSADSHKIILQHINNQNDFFVRFIFSRAKHKAVQNWQFIMEAYLQGNSTQR